MNDATADQTPLDREAAGRSRGIAIALLVAGLLGVFLALWGWTGVVRNAAQWWTEHTTLGMSPWVPFVIGLLLVVLAAVADVLLGRHADISQVVAGQRADAAQTFVNRLAPWVLVLIAAVGVLLIWLRYR